jgi:hypothetical protein
MPPKQKKAKIPAAKQSKQATLDGWLALPPSKKQRVKSGYHLHSCSFQTPILSTRIPSASSRRTGCPITNMTTTPAGCGAPLLGWSCWSPPSPAIRRPPDHAPSRSRTNDQRVHDDWNGVCSRLYLTLTTSSTCICYQLLIACLSHPLLLAPPQNKLALSRNSLCHCVLWSLTSKIPNCSFFSFQNTCPPGTVSKQ